MTSTEHEIRPERVAASPAELIAEVTRLRAQLAERDRRIEALTDEMHTMQRTADDLLDRESMHCYAPDMERLATPAAMDRLGARRAEHPPVLSVVPELEITAPRIELGVWQGFQR